MVTISKAKAKRLGIADDKRKNLSRSELTKAEKASGQYEVRHEKTFLTDEARAKYKPETITKQPEVKTTPKVAEPIVLDKPKVMTPAWAKSSEVIKLEPKKTGIATAREEDTIAGKAIKVMTSPETTLVLGATLATLLTMGGSTAATAGITTSAGARAVITRTATLGTKTLTTQRAFVGRTINSNVNKIFAAGGRTASTGARYITNAKTTGLTKSLLSKTGLTMGAAGILLGAVGSYPFAGFIKEEALQTLNIPITSALINGDLEGAKKLTDEVDELINNQGTIMSKIPYLNVLESLKGFFKSASLANEEWKRVINKIETEGTASEKAREEEANYYEGVRKDEEERKSKEREEEEKYYSDIEEKNKKEELEDMQWKAEYYDLIRQKRYEEAEELLKSKS